MRGWRVGRYKGRESLRTSGEQTLNNIKTKTGHETILYDTILYHNMLYYSILVTILYYNILVYYTIV